MPDREKVEKGLNICKSINHPCNECPYVGERNCSLAMVEDALALIKEQEDLGTELTNAVELIHKKNERIEKLLKEQEAVKPVLDEQTGRIWLCGNCGSYVGFEDNDPHDPNEFDKYCRECGRPVLWEGR